MATIETFRRSTPVPSFGLIARVRETISSWVNVQVTRKELNRLSDRELNDIGLCRSDIDRIARGI
jgi:uncharacterized protein YjiS (DUF1127 family)